MKDKAKWFRNILIFILLIVLTFYILLKDSDISEIFNVIKNVKIQYIIIAIMCMIMYVLLEAVNLGRTLKKLKAKTTLLKNIKYALIGFFFSAITPAASGGQPMQAYYMHKDKISVSSATLALLINLSSMQIITIGFALISLIFTHQYLNNTLIFFLIIGLFLNFSALALLIIGIFSKKMSKGLIKLVLRIMKFFRVKNVDDKVKRFAEELHDYQKGSKYIKNNKLLIVKILLTTLIQFTFYYSVTYCVFRAINLNETSIIQILAMQSVAYAIVSGIPSPGSVGVSEGAFIEMFKNISPEGTINSIVILTRAINFYLLVLVSGIVVIINNIKILKVPKKEIKELNQKN